MRRIVVFLLLIAFCLVAGVAAIFQAPRVQATLADRVADAIVASSANQDVEIAVNGRFIEVTGSVWSQADRETVVQSIDSVRGHLDIRSDAVTILPPAQPFAFSIDKASNGQVKIEGFAPDEPTRQMILLRAQDLFGADNVTAKIDLASGMPDADWPNMTDRGMEAISQLIEGKASLADQSLGITGTAETFEFAKRVETTLKRNLPEQYRDKGRLDIGWLPPMIDPYQFEIVKSANGIQIAGAVPNEGLAQQIVSQVRQSHPGVPIETSLVTGRGMPTASWPADVLLAASKISNLDRGRIRFDDLNVFVEGQTGLDLQRRNVAAALESLQGYSVTGRIDLPATVNLPSDSGDNAERSVPQEPQTQTDDEAVGDAVPTTGDVSEDVPAQTDSPLPQTATGDSGPAVVNDQELLASFDPELWFAGELVESNGFQLPKLVAAPSRAACDRWFAWRQRRDRITFASGSADLGEDNRVLLNEIASVLSACLAVDGAETRSGVSVVGHTDSTGSADANKALSTQRAQSVVAALVARGVNAQRLNSFGVGGDEPVASNETDEGKAENRRIEFRFNSQN